MKKIVKALAFGTLFLTSLSAFAADDTGFKIDSVNGGDVKFSWNENEKAPFSTIFYSETSSEPGKYSMETDLLEGTSHTIKSLKSNSDYYFMLELYDSEGQKVATSEEIKTKIGENGMSAGFKLQEVQQVENNKIKLIFSNNLDTTQTQDALNFKIEAVNDTSDYLEISGFNIDENNPKELVLELDRDITDNVEYKVIAISVLDSNQNNIEYGVDSEATFTGDIELNAAGPTEEKNEKEKEEPTPTPNKEKEKETKDTSKVKKQPASISGKDIKKEDVVTDVNSVSKDKEKLPDTGPEHLILLFLALLISAAVFVPKYMKN